MITRFGNRDFQINDYPHLPDKRAERRRGRGAIRWLQISILANILIAIFQLRNHRLHNYNSLTKRRIQLGNQWLSNSKMTKMNIPLKGQNRICYSTNFHLRTWLLYSLLVADSVQGTNGRISEEGKQGVRQIARIHHQAMKKLGGYFCFKKTRIDGKTKGKMFGSFKKNVYFCDL